MFNWKQVAAGYAERDMEIKDARDAFTKQMSLNSRKYLMESGVEKLESIRKRRSERMSKIQLAGNFGISKEAAVVMDASGDLDIALNHLSKLKPTEINKDNIKAISETVLSSYPEEVKSKILANSLLLGTDFDPADLGMQLAMAAFDPDQTLEDIKKIYGQIPSDDSSIRIPSANVPLRSAINIPPTEMNTVNKFINSSLNGIIGDFQSDTNKWVWDDPDNGNRIIRELQDVYRTAYSDTTYSGNPLDILSDVINNVSDQIRSGGNQLADVVVSLDPIPTTSVPPPITSDPIPTTSDPIPSINNPFEDEDDILDNALNQ